MQYEDLVNEAEKNGIEVIDRKLSKNIKGLYSDNIIAINDTLSSKEKNCVMAEELGHYYLTSGNILNSKSIKNRKEEIKARVWAYNKHVGIIGLINCYKNRCTNISEMAEYLNVTENFLREAIGYYTSKYGGYITIDSYTIMFSPCFCIIENINVF